MGKFTFDAIWGPMFHGHKSSAISPAVPTVSGIDADGKIADIPAGTMLEKIHVTNAGAAIDVNFGTSAGGDQIAKEDSIPGADRQSFGKDYTSPTGAAFSVYISKVGGGAWGTSSLTIRFITRKI